MGLSSFEKEIETVEVRKSADSDRRVAESEIYVVAPARK
jgi:hypothetical protein